MFNFLVFIVPFMRGLVLVFPPERVPDDIEILDVSKEDNAPEDSSPPSEGGSVE